MITLRNGYSFKYAAASGALGNAGFGWPQEKLLGFISKKLFDPSLFFPFAKTFTYNPNKGNFRWYNPFGCIRFIKDGVVNAYGLTNLGRIRWYEKYGCLADPKKMPQAVSISGTPHELRQMAIELNDFNFVAVEINGSCPNDKTSLLQKSKLAVDSVLSVRDVTNLPIIFKWSVAQKEIAKVVSKEISGIVSAFSINSVPWKIIFPNKASPLEHLGGGGVSGKVAQPFTWDMAKMLKLICDVPVIWPGIWDYQDIAAVEKMGADAISFGSIFLRYPWRPTLYVQKDKKRTV